MSEPDAFAVSAEQIPASDLRDAAVKTVSSKCREIIEVCHLLQRLDDDLYAAQTFSPVDVKKLTEIAIAHGKAEERFWNLRREIEEMERHYNSDLGYGIYVVHTAAGVPIRVSLSCKKSPWQP